MLLPLVRMGTKESPPTCSSPGLAVNWDTRGKNCIGMLLTLLWHQRSIPWSHQHKGHARWLWAVRNAKGGNISGCPLTLEEGKQSTSQFSKQPFFSKLAMLTSCERRRQLKCSLAMGKGSLGESSLDSEEVPRKDWSSGASSWISDSSLSTAESCHLWSLTGALEEFPGIPELLCRVLVTNCFPLDKHMGGRVCPQWHQEVS